MGLVDEALAVGAFFEEGLPREWDPVDDCEVSERVLGGRTAFGAPRGETALGLGLAICLHALAPLLIVLLGLLCAAPPVSEKPFATVSLVTLAGAGLGQGGFPGAPGPGAAGCGEKKVSPDPPSPAVLVKKMAQGKPREMPARAVKPVERLPSRKPVIARRRREKAVRPPEPHREEAGEQFSAPVGAQPARSGQASGLGRGLNSPGAGVGSFPGAGVGGGGTGSGHGSGGSGGFGLNQVDIPPIPIKRVKPEFPGQAKEMGLSGKVVLKFLVEADGRVANASVILARPQGVFDRSALEAIGEWRFRPGRYKGKAVAVWVELPVCFRLAR